MKTTRLLFGAALLLGGCDLLWAPFQGPNAAFCDPTLAACGVNGGDGAATGDAAVDAAVPVDGGAAVDAATPVDLLNCQPAAASKWLVPSTSPPASGTIAFTGVTGNGMGGVWVVGSATYVAYWNGASWNAVTAAPLISSQARAGYSAQAGRALAAATGTLGANVVSMTTSMASANLIGSLGTQSGGIWVGPDVTATAYAVAGDGTFKSSNNGTSWTAVGATAPPNVNVLSGPPKTAAAPIWGISTADRKVTQYPGSGATWNTVTSGTLVFNSVFYGANNLVWLVGNGGIIRTVPANQPPSGTFTTVNSTVNTALNDVAGTQLGTHLFIVGDSATILHYEAKCQTWTTETSPVMHDLSAVWVDDTQSMVWAVGASGTVINRSIP